MSGGLRLEEIVARLGGTLAGDGSVYITQIATLASAGEGQIAFLANPKYRKQLATTQASAVIVPPLAADDTSLPRIVVGNSYAYYARVAALLNPAQQRPVGSHPTAVVHSPVPSSACIGEHVVVGADVTLGERVVLHPGVVIGDGVSIGDDCVLFPNVVVYRNCRLGARVTIQAGAIVGSDGFGYAKDEGKWLKIPQIGRVIIGDDVEIGANTTIDRGALDDTLIGNGVILDNQIQIAHNCQIGESTAMAGCVGVAGSTKIGARCTVGGAGMIIGHLEIGDDVHISAGTMVTKSIAKPGQYTSIYPLEPHGEWLHNAAQIKRLGRLADRVASLEKMLEKKLEEMEKTN